MISLDFIDLLSQFKVTSYAGVEDFADKFNFLITVIVLLLCTLIVTTKQYIMKPIVCYIAVDVGGTNILDYVENYCWVQGTIPFPENGTIPDNGKHWNVAEEQKILYYQWVPFVLGLQAILFYLPRAIWQTICFNRIGTDLEHIISMASAAAHADEGGSKTLVDQLAVSIERLLFQRCAWKDQRKVDYKNSRAKRSHEAFSVHKDTELDGKVYKYGPLQVASMHGSRFNKHRGTYVVATYIFMKFLYLTNAVGQLFLMQHFLGFTGDSLVFGIQVLKNVLQGQDWQLTLIFPRVAYCYVRVKALATQYNSVTAQCALPVNMLNEKIYVFLWWWILIAALLTAVSIILWLLRVIGQSRGSDYIDKYLRLSGSLSPVDEDKVSTFARHFLRRDGVFLIRMISTNAGDLVAAEVAAKLWCNYIERFNSHAYDPFTNLPLRGEYGETQDQLGKSTNPMPHAPSSLYPTVRGADQSSSSSGGSAKKNVV